MRQFAGIDLPRGIGVLERRMHIWRKDTFWRKLFINILEALNEVNVKCSAFSKNKICGKLEKM